MLNSESPLAGGPPVQAGNVPPTPVGGTFPWVTISCESCREVAQIRFDHPLDYRPKYIRFCPMCGQSHLRIITDMRGEWVIYSQRTGLPVELLKNLYDLWKPDDGDPDNFFDFLRENGADGII